MFLAYRPSCTHFDSFSGPFRGKSVSDVIVIEHPLSQQKDVGSHVTGWVSGSHLYTLSTPQPQDIDGRPVNIESHRRRS